MNTYITGRDIAISVNANGRFEYNTTLIRQTVAKNFAFPDWVMNQVHDILDNDELNNLIKDTPLQAIVNTKVVLINNILVPVIRTAKVVNSELSRFISVNKFIDYNDIYLSLAPLKNEDPPYFGARIIDLTKIFTKLADIGVTIDDDDQAYISKAVNNYVEEIAINTPLVDIENIEKSTAVAERMKMGIASVIGFSIIARLTPIITRAMNDLHAAEPYFTINKDGAVEVDSDKLFMLMDAFGYAVYGEDREIHTQFIDFKNKLIESMNKELKAIYDFTNADLTDEFLLSHLSLTVNNSGINRIKFMFDNEINLQDVGDVIFPDSLLTQSEIESVFIDRITEFTTIDNVIEDLQMSTDLPKYQVDEYVNFIVDEVGNVVKLLVESGAPPHKVYEGASKTYVQMLDKETERLKEIKPSTMKAQNSTMYGTNTLTWLNSST